MPYIDDKLAELARAEKDDPQNMSIVDYLKAKASYESQNKNSKFENTEKFEPFSGNKHVNSFISEFKVVFAGGGENKGFIITSQTKPNETGRFLKLNTSRTGQYSEPQNNAQKILMKKPETLEKLLGGKFEEHEFMSQDVIVETTPLLPGGDFHDVARKGGGPSERTARALQKTKGIMTLMHMLDDIGQKDDVHLALTDMKSAQVLLDKDGNPHVSDWKSLIQGRYVTKFDAPTTGVYESSETLSLKSNETLDVRALNTHQLLVMNFEMLSGKSIKDIVDENKPFTTSKDEYNNTVEEYLSIDFSTCFCHTVTKDDKGNIIGKSEKKPFEPDFEKLRKELENEPNSDFKNDIAGQEYLAVLNELSKYTKARDVTLVTKNKKDKITAVSEHEKRPMGENVNFGLISTILDDIEKDKTLRKEKEFKPGVINKDLEKSGITMGSHRILPKVKDFVKAMQRKVKHAIDKWEEKIKQQNQTVSSSSSDSVSEKETDILRRMPRHMQETILNDTTRNKRQEKRGNPPYAKTVQTVTDKKNAPTSTPPTSTSDTEKENVVPSSDPPTFK